MTDKELSDKLDAILERLPLIDALGSVLVRRQTAIERSGAHRNSLNEKDDFQEVGKRKVYIEIGEIPVVRRRKGNKHRSRFTPE